MLVKNIKYLLFMLLLIPLNGFAIEFYCDRTVKSGNDFKCILSNSSNSLYNLTANLDYGNDIKLKSEVYSKGYNNSGNNSDLNIMGPGFNAPTTIGIFTFSAPKVGNDQKYIISLGDVKYKYLSSESSFHDNGDLNYTITVKGDGSSSTTSSTTTTTTTTTTVVGNKRKYELNLYFMDESQTLIKTGCETTEDSGCETYIADITPPTNEGYEFIGWSEDTLCDNYKKYSVYNLTKNTSLYACFKNNNSEENINYLKDLSVEGYEIIFSKFVYRYYISIKGDTSKLNIVANALSDTAVVKISDNVNNLVDGLNTITIDVVDNDITTTYVILVSKNLSDVPMLKNITIDKYNLNFEQSVFEYNLVVKYGVKKLKLNIVNDYNYEYEVIGNDNISDGSQIIVKVKNGTIESNYVIKIKYESFINSYLYYVYGISFGLFCIIVYFIVKYMKSDKYKIKKEKKEVKKVNLEPPKDKATKKNNKVKKTKKQKQEKIEKL